MSTEPIIQTCPYCLLEIEENSKDHIFPQFLGGTRKINACRKCNSLFGHTFEGKAAAILQPLHVFICSWGVPLKAIEPIWKSAHVEGGKVYNLSVGPTGVVPSLSKSVFEFDDMGHVTGGEFESEKLAKQFANSLLKKGKTREVRIEKLPPPEISLQGLGHTLILGPDLRRTALKMCMSLATLLPDFTQSELHVARTYLTNFELSVENTLPAYDLYPQIDESRKPLCHVIYVERGERYVSGFIQWFGVIQIYCHLGESVESAKQTALLATLDPTNGEETFVQKPLLNLKEPPAMILRTEYPELMAGWINKFRSEAIGRNATHPPDLRIEDFKIDFG